MGKFTIFFLLRYLISDILLTASICTCTFMLLLNIRLLSRKIYLDPKLSVVRPAGGASFLYGTQTRNQTNMTMAGLPNIVVVGGSYVGSSISNQPIHFIKLTYLCDIQASIRPPN
jgi:hypothetical protein